MIVKPLSAIPRLGVRADDFRREIKPALRIARDAGFQAVELCAAQGELTPANLSRTARRDLSHQVASLGLDLSALDASPAGGGYADSRTAERALEQSLAIIDLAAEIKSPSVITRVMVPDSDDTQEARLIAEALCAMADRADRAGVRLGIAPHGGNAAWLNQALAAMNCSSLWACLDTGDWLTRGVAPEQVIAAWRGRLALARIRDGQRGTPEHPGAETPFGGGALDPDATLAALAAADYSAPLILSRRGGDTPQVDLAVGAAVWRRILDSHAAR